MASRLTVSRVELLILTIAAICTNSWISFACIAILSAVWSENWRQRLRAPVYFRARVFLRSLKKRNVSTAADVLDRRNPEPDTSNFNLQSLPNSTATNQLLQRRNFTPLNIHIDDVFSTAAWPTTNWARSYGRRRWQDVIFAYAQS